MSCTLDRLTVAALVSLLLAGCDGGGNGPPRDGSPDVPDGDGDSSLLEGLPEQGEVLDPALYDCRAESSPPERVSTLALGCFRDPSCEGLVVVAHRGSGFFAPENTLSAIRSAIALGVDMVELDSRVTADGIVVLIHDGEIDRTTMGTGEVSELMVNDIRGLPLRLEEAMPAEADFSCERVPTLREALELCRNRVDVMLDMKEGPVEAALVVDQLDMIDQVVMLASASELAQARAEVPELRIMVRPREHEEVVPLWEAFDPPPDVVHIDDSFDDAETIDAIHALPARVLIDMWPADVAAAFLGDFTGYAEGYDRGLDIQQSEWPFFALWSVGRADPP